MISNIDQRVFKYTALDQSWLDLTIAVNDPRNNSVAPLTMNPGDYIYVSAFLPFNHKFFKLSVSALVGVKPTIEICNGFSAWSSVVDTLDYTAGMTTSNGVIQWTVDWDQTWGRVSRNRTDVLAMAGAPLVYDAYWLRMSWPVIHSFTLEYIGQIFSSDADLFAQYPVLQNSTIMQGWKAGKTDWLDQHILAASYISKELIQRNIILDQSQILDISTMRSAAVHKAANIIYSGLGAKNYSEEIKLSGSLFEQAMRMDKFQVDANANARKDVEEHTISTVRATR